MSLGRKGKERKGRGKVLKNVAEVLRAWDMQEYQLIDLKKRIDTYLSG
jgi:hypothetical protein